MKKTVVNRREKLAGRRTSRPSVILLVEAGRKKHGRDDVPKIEGRSGLGIGYLDDGASVGIKLGWNLYTAFREKELLKPKHVDMILWNWMQASYRDKLVVDGFDIPDDKYQVGKPNA